MDGIGTRVGRASRIAAPERIDQPHIAGHTSGFACSYGRTILSSLQLFAGGRCFRVQPQWRCEGAASVTITGTTRMR